MIGETSAQNAPIEVRAPGTVRAANARAGFRVGAPGRRAQDAQAQDANARMRAPIFDLRATNRQAPDDPRNFETGRAPAPVKVYGAAKPAAETMSVSASLRSLASSGHGERNPLRRLSVNDAYLSAETLDGPYAHRGSIFDLQI